MCLLPQVALPFHGRIAKELLEREPLLERHWPLKVLHLHVSANTHSAETQPWEVITKLEVHSQLGQDCKDLKMSPAKIKTVVPCHACDPY